MNQTRFKQAIRIVIPFAWGLLWSGLALGETAPLDVRGVLTPDSKCFTLIWHEPAASVMGFNVYRRSSPWTSGAKLNSSPVSVPVFADRVDGSVYYYSVRSVDHDGVESAESWLVDSSPDTNVVFTSPDGSSIVTIPASSAAPLYSYSNSLGVPVRLAATEVSLPDNPDMIRLVKFQLLRADTGEEIADALFEKGHVQVEIGVSVLNGLVARGGPASNGRFGVTSTRPEALSLHWFNGNSWIKFGAIFDASANRIKATSRYLGLFAVQNLGPAQQLSLNKANVYPPIFTPNGDGRNDRVYFVLENPHHADVSGAIYDLSGRHVVSLSWPARGRGRPPTLEWDGKDASGAPVFDGLYIYRIAGDGQTLTGSVAVAR